MPALLHRLPGRFIRRLAPMLLSGVLGTAAAVDFSAEIRPILSQKCFQCHGQDEGSRKAGLRLDLGPEAIRERKGVTPIAPGQPAASEIIRRMTSTDPDEVMPPPETRNPVTPDEIELVRAWIASGAEYSPHWAWRAPTRPAPPQVADPAWARNGIDPFIQARLEAVGRTPSPEADRETLARRVAIDLTGLPPDPAARDAFLADTRADAYERYVDSLLASPRYGERWARMWLDLARYADSAGYGSDPLRPHIWPYRDWVIQAFNRNLTYEQFSREQLAGDLLDAPTREQVIATAFHRNTMTNTEGGTEDEEWRVAAVKDRANVTAQVWMGLTLGCAQCHTHKFDPITHREYYGFYAFFNQTEDNDQPDERPTLPLLRPDEEARREALRTEIAALEERHAADDAEYLAERDAWTVAAARPVAWEPVPVEAALSAVADGARLDREPDGTLRAQPGGAGRDHYMVQVRIDDPADVTALRLEVLPDPGLPGSGPGTHPGDGNFVLNDLRAFVAPAPAAAAPARYVRIEGLGGRRQLALAEVQVFSGLTNLAPGGTPRQSTTTYLADPARAIDGNTDGNVNAAHSVSLTLPEELPWWELDLGRTEPVTELALWNRTDGSEGQLGNVRVTLLDADRQPVWSTRLDEPPRPVTRIGPSGGARPLALREATADHAQPGFAAAGAIDARAHRDSGWAVGGATGAAHQLAVELDAPLGRPGPVTLLLHLSQNHGEHQLLGRFRWSLTRHAPPVRLLPTAVAAALEVGSADRTDEQLRVLDRHFRPLARTRAGLRGEIAARRNELASIRGTPVPILREVPPDRQRTTRILNKGNYLDPAGEVGPTVPEAFHGWPEGRPRDRRGLVDWLFDPANPLTARVAVNRFWSQIFGRGLVETEEDFGTQGTLPSHPELLDWLAVTFQSPPDDSRPGAPALGWDMKALVRLMVTSATYRQTAAVPADVREADPANILLGRATRRRLDAEAVRDQALSVAGLLGGRIGGPSVYPYQPEGLWRAAFNGERTWATSPGDDRYRRGIYTFLRRTVPYPSMATFDAPSRESCTVRRLPTNTPLQAFVTLNDPVFVEAAQALARRLLHEAGPDPEARAAHGFRLATGRIPSAADLAPLLRLHRAELERLRADPEAARALAGEPPVPNPQGVPSAELAAWTSVANVLLNLDALLNRG